MIRSLNVQRIWCPYDHGRPLSSNAVPLRPNLHRRRLHICCIASLSTNAAASSTTLTSSIGSPPSSRPLLSQWNLTQRHILILNFIACTAAISTTWLFCAAIPTLLAFKRAAESLEKVLDVTREELPDTMAAVRLSGMEMSDLTMELSDLGQGITEGVKRSTRAVGLAEERLRGLSNINPSGSARMQVVVGAKSKAMVGRGARSIRENIVKGRAFVEMFFTLTHFSKVAFKYFTRSKTASKRDR